VTVARNVADVRTRIQRACENSNRTLQDVTIIAVTKNVDIETAKEVIGEEIVHLGENRVEPFLAKYEEIGNNASWHFIGSLQTRKVKHVINEIDYLHSLDRMSLADEIEKRAERKIKCFVQVKTSTEETKQGLNLEEVVDFIASLACYEKIEVIGLMTMAPFTEETEEIRNCFRQLKHLQEKIQSMDLTYAPCTELSMGMSNDFEIAIEEGATFIRLGTILVEK
jgi:PLP dependent protein